MMNFLAIKVFQFNHGAISIGEFLISYIQES